MLFSFPSFVSAHSYSSLTFHSSLVNPHSQSRQWVGSIWRSFCPSSVQLSFSHVYIRVRLAAVSGQLGVLRHWPVKRNVVIYSKLSPFPTWGSSHIVVKKVYWFVKCLLFVLALKPALLALFLFLFLFLLFLITASGYHQLQPSLSMTCSSISFMKQC